jgi:hypothetical protein
VKWKRQAEVEAHAYPARVLHVRQNEDHSGGLVGQPVAAETAVEGVKAADHHWWGVGLVGPPLNPRRNEKNVWNEERVQADSAYVLQENG